MNASKFADFTLLLVASCCAGVYLNSWIAGVGTYCALRYMFIAITGEE